MPPSRRWGRACRPSIQAVTDACPISVGACTALPGCMTSVESALNRGPPDSGSAALMDVIHCIMGQGDAGYTGPFAGSISRNPQCTADCAPPTSEIGVETLSESWEHHTANALVE